MRETIGKKVNPKQAKDQLKDEPDENVQYVVNRQRIGFSEIPLESLFNPSIDKIKAYERKQGKNPAPINLTIVETMKLNDHHEMSQ
jgi:hypothetical protein